MIPEIAASFINFSWGKKVFDQIPERVKCILLFSFCLLGANFTALTTYSQTIGATVKSWSANAPETDANNLMTRNLRDAKFATGYYDGLGRPLQTVINKGSLTTAANTDLVTANLYDEYGREVQKYLPYASPTSDGSYKSTAFTEQNTFYT